MPNTRVAKFARVQHAAPAPGMLVRYYIGTRICTIVRSAGPGKWVVQGYMHRHQRTGLLVPSKPVQRTVVVYADTGRPYGMAYWQPCTLV